VQTTASFKTQTTSSRCTPTLKTPPPALAGDARLGACGAPSPGDNRG
jgi:hypothetical protein